ncbi:MAG: hypothetical protein E7409_02650 [Ruminococcaceae bacterium]|nr:hypothetical protein [Oscillospiraceae bacterium]
MVITDVQAQKRNPQRVSVYVDNAYAFSLDGTDFVRMGLKIGKALTEQEIRTCLLESDLSKARAKALDILSRRMICERELRRKLAEKGHDQMIIDVAMDELTALGYIDDYAYAVQFIENARICKSQGMRRIRYDLAQKGVDGEVIRQAAEQFQPPTGEEIAELIQNRYGDEDLTDRKIRDKITRYLAGKGYDFSQISEGLRYVQESREEFE